MKKIIINLATSLFLLTGTASYAESIDIVNHYSPTGLAASLTQELSSLKSFNTRIINLGRGNCSGVLDYLKSTNKPTVALWFWFMHEFGNNKACKDLDPELFVTAYTIAYINICSNNLSDNIDTFLSGNYRVGYPAHYSNEIIMFKELFNSLKIDNVSFVPYGGGQGAKEVRAAIEIGEIAYGLFTTPSSDLNCELTTDPKATNNRVSVYSLSDKYITPYPLFTTFVIIGKNIDIDYVRQQVLKLTNTEGWLSKFVNFYSDRPSYAREKQLQLYLKDLEILEANIKNDE